MKKKALYLLLSTIVVASVLTGCSMKEKEKDNTSLKDNNTKIEDTTNNETETEENEKEETTNQEEEEELQVVDVLINNLQKPLSELELYEEKDRKIKAPKTETQKYWLYAQTYDTKLLSDYDRNLKFSDVMFMNPTNDWKSTDDFTVCYYNISGSEMNYIFKGLKTEDGYPTIEYMKEYFGEPVCEIEDSYAFEYKDDCYVTAIYNAKWRCHDYALCKKEDISYVNPSFAEQLGIENKREEDLVVFEGTTNYSMGIPHDNGTVKLKMCDRIITLNNLSSDDDIEINKYVLTEDGTYIVNGFLLRNDNDHSLSIELPMYNTFGDMVYPFYSKSLLEGKIGEIIDETNDYIIYAIDPSTTFSGNTSEYCIYIKSYDTYFTAYSLKYNSDHTENLNYCKEIVDYINSNIVVEKVK